MSYSARRRMKAMIKLADGSLVQCAICGCPHAEIMHIGHPERRGGRFHRDEIDSASMAGWILRTPLEEVKERVQLECPYCNSWHNKFKEYPPEDKQPQWDSYIPIWIRGELFFRKKGAESEGEDE